MDTGIRRNTSNIIDDLIKNGPAYNVWQAVWVAENITKKSNPNRKDFLLDQAGLKFRPYEKYEYPPRDIRSISYEENAITFILTFMGLYGINSPLPRCYHEQVAMQQRILGTSEVPLQNFLDIFNNRFYWLYYQSWKKYRFYLYINGEADNKIIERINSFTGRGLLSKKRRSNLSDFILLKFSGIFTQRVRNKAGLKILLSYIFPEYKMKIREFIPRWIELSEIPALGEDSNSLSMNSYIGNYAMDYTSRICIEIGPITFEDYLDFLPGTNKANRLIELLKIYLNDGLEFDFEFKIKSETIVSVSWNDDRLKLGSTLWLGKPENELVKVYLRYEEMI